MNRRQALQSGAAVLASLSAAGCDFLDWFRRKEPLVSGVIDIHCHLFNGSDLPTVRFIKIVILHNYPRQGIQTLDIRDPDALDGLIALFTAIVGRTQAPTAGQEIAVLQRRAERVARNADPEANEAAVVEVVGEFLSQNQLAVAGDISPSAFRTIRRSILSAAGVQGAAVADESFDPQEARALATKAYHSDFDLGLMLRWFGLFTRYRYSLADRLDRDHTYQGFKPLLLCPATIDYDKWLGENIDADASPLPQQVDVMGALARRTTGPVVHGYVAYDPLRQAYFAAGKFNDFDPLGVVKHALRDEGFVGVKLYPPMGFRAAGNERAVCQLYPQWAVSDLATSRAPDARTSSCKPRPAAGSIAIGAMIDKALADLFELCVAEDACIIAHANHSNEAGEHYADRADPAYWKPVFGRWPKLRVCLAHFGHFVNKAADAPAGATALESTWEWSLGRYLKSAGDPPVFADISYIDEIAPPEGAVPEEHVRALRQWLDAFDPECRHLVFGTDWTMMGLSQAYEGYTKRVYAFFRDKMNFDKPRLDRLFFANAGRFLGLRQGDAARDRLLAFYDRNKLPRERLPLIAAI